MIAIFMESLAFQPGCGDRAGPRWAASLFVRALGVVMTWFWRWARPWRAAAVAGLVAVTAAAVLTASGEAGAATPGRRGPRRRAHAGREVRGAAPRGHRGRGPLAVVPPPGPRPPQPSA